MDDNKNNNKAKEYNDEIKSKNKNATKKLKKNEKIDKKIDNEQGNYSKKEENKINIVIQNNKSSKKETIEDILNKASVKKKLPPIIMENNILDNNKDDLLKDNSVSTPNMNINKYLKMQIDEKMKKIEDLSISQDINKKTLTELLQKLNNIIKSNAELLYSGVDPNNEKKENDNKKDKEKRIKELNLILENKKRELNQSKETNKNFKNKYENMMKEYTTSSLSKIDDFQKKINNIKNNNIELNKKINLLNYNNHLKGKKLDLKSKNRDKKEIKIYSDEYATIMKEKYSQFAKLNANKKLIKDIVEQFQYLIKLLNNEDNKKEKEKENEKNSERNCFIK